VTAQITLFKVGFEVSLWLWAKLRT